MSATLILVMGAVAMIALAGWLVSVLRADRSAASGHRDVGHPDVEHGADVEHRDAAVAAGGDPAEPAVPVGEDRRSSPVDR